MLVSGLTTTYLMSGISLFPTNNWSLAQGHRALEFSFISNLLSNIGSLSNHDSQSIQISESEIVFWFFGVNDDENKWLNIKKTMA